LGLNETVVGLVFAIQGVSGLFSAFAFGREDTRGRERMLLAIPMAITGIAIAVLMVKTSLITLALVMTIVGALNGPIDIALFTLRQRRTDPSWMGRAFAVSMSFNYVGTPVGAALAGILATRSLEVTIAFAALASLISGGLAAVMIPQSE
jgi:predicted MFS family arabinose efflux permease